MSAKVLEAESITVHYGGICAVKDVSLSVARGEVVALLGANGSGKSSFLRAVSGLERRTGRVVLDGVDVTSKSAHGVTRAGLVHVPEGRGVIAPLTVEENLQLAHGAAGRGGSQAEMIDAVYAMFPRLAERRHQLSGLLSGGEQQMLAIGRGLAMRPLVLLLDEPSMGLAPIVVAELYASLEKRYADFVSDVAIVLAEQSTRLAVGVADRAYLLSRGEVVFEGDASDMTDDVALKAYLGA